MRYRLPRELERLRDFLEAERPHKDLSLEESITEDAHPLANPARALATAEFQGGVFMLLRALEAGRITVARRRRPSTPEPPVEPSDDDVVPVLRRG